MKNGLLVLLLVLCILTGSAPILLNKPEKVVVVVEVKQPINEGAHLLIARAVAEANSLSASCLIIVLDTYGGYLYSMDAIVSELSKCQCIKIAWIPPGAKAVSAGAIIALSADEIYMGSGAVIGACKPYPYETKVVEYVKARIRSLAEKRGLSNGTIRTLEKMVYESKAFTTEEALKLGLASGRADSLSEVLVKLGLKGARLVVIRPDLTVEIAALIFDPAVALIMLITGILLILLEIKATGFQGWGLLGGFLIALSLYVMGIIGWRILSLVLVALGIFSIILELKKPGIQIFGVIGVTLLTLAVILEAFSQPYMNPWTYIPPLAFFTAVVSSVILLIILKASKVLKMPIPTLEEKLSGKIGYAKTEISPNKPGVVIVENEEWSAISSEKIEKGERIVVEKVEGLTLIIRKATKENTSKDTGSQKK